MSNDSTKTSDTVEKHFFRASAADFKKIPGNPIAYWASQKLYKQFEDLHPISTIAECCTGLQTSDNNKFLRSWWEVNSSNIGFGLSSLEKAADSNFKWYPYNKGGGYRKWYGNNQFIVNWKNNGEELYQFARKLYGSPTRIIKNTSYYFKPSITWSFISSAYFGARFSKAGFIFDNAGASAFSEERYFPAIGAFLCSKIAPIMLALLNPTLNFQVGNIASLPLIIKESKDITNLVHKVLSRCESDWDSYETSWDFASFPFLSPCYRQPILNDTYQKLRAYWQEMTQEMQRLEEENNRIFINAYGLQDELTSDVPLNEITLTCNPHYRYGNNKTEAELETLLLADTICEFISYAVGCMFGRYALDKSGLILANQGETIEDYYKKLQEPQTDTPEHKNNQTDIRVNSCSFVVQKSDVLFPADDDNVIPMLDGDWFTDDVTERFGQFLKVTFGDAHYEENLKFIEQALGKDIRKYFLKDFYPDHLKRYKKRPIYWLFSSPKGTFNALIYMHRYRPDTVSVVLNDYLREFRTKLSAHKNHLEAVSISSNASAGEKTKALKDIENHRKMIDELDVYEREVLYPLATEQVEIDLDDGVKVNYQMFGEALKKIPGLAAKED